MGTCELGKLRLLQARSQSTQPPAQSTQRRVDRRQLSCQQIGPDELEKFAKCHSVVGVGHRGDREDLQQTGRVPRALGIGVFEGRQAGRRRAIMSGKRPWRIAVVRARGKHSEGYPREGHPRYVKDGTVPQSIGKGRALMHNHIRHSLDMPCGENGFRAWTDDRPPLGFKRCGCGWSGLPHYSATPDYRCEPRSRLPQ